MAGYKQTAVDDGAVSLWTFDGDAFDSVTRKLLVPDGDPLIIMDEIDNLNPAILNSDHETYLGYRLGTSSLVIYEQTDQHSMSFGFYGKQPAHPNQWAKSYLEIPNSISYAFPNYGSFSVEFVFYKEFSNDEGTQGVVSYKRPIIKKNGVFNIYFNFPWGVPPTIVIEHPGGTATVNLAFKTNYSLIGKTTHFVFTWETSLEDNNEYKSLAKVYINSHLASEQSYTYFDVFPNTNVDSSILIGGNSGINRLLDWHTSNFQMDQIAIYDKALTKRTSC